MGALYEHACMRATVHMRGVDEAVRERRAVKLLLRTRELFGSEKLSQACGLSCQDCVMTLEQWILCTINIESNIFYDE